MNALPTLNHWQLSRGELTKLHNHKNVISGYRAERSCQASPTKQANRRVGLKLGQKGKSSKAFFSHTQHSTAYSCPIAFQRSRAAHNADLTHLLSSHYRTGGMVLFGSLGMAVTNSPAPKHFYDAREAFRTSQEWKEAEQTHGKFKNITQAVASPAWAKFLAAGGKQASYSEWDLTKRLDAVGEAQTFTFTARDLNRIMKRVGVTLVGHVIVTEIQVTPSPTMNGSRTAWWGKTRNNIHTHFLLFLENGSVTQKQVKALLVELHKRWAKTVAKHGFRSTLAGSDLRPVKRTETDLTALGAYVAKGTSVNADPAGLGFSFWDALRDSSTGDIRATQWWKNFEGAVRGRKGMFRISYSLMSRYQVKEAREARAAKWRASNPEPSPVAWFDSTDWWQATSSFPELREQLLLVAEQEGVEGTRRFLEDNGIKFFLNDVNRELKTDAWSQLQAARSRKVA